MEALYETLLYWMGIDTACASTSTQNRGVFTAQFAVQRLLEVFGAENVLANIEIVESKDTKLAEIDLLVRFGNSVLVLQAKSKRLTIQVRRGNDLQIKDDLKKTIQDSSGQAYRCARLTEEGKCSFGDVYGDAVRRRQASSGFT